MSIHAFDLQASIYNALNGDSTLSALVNGIFDDVPEGTAYPYVVIGEESASNSGTKTLDGNTHTLTIHVWSSYRGRKEIKEIMSAIYDVLHESSLTISGASLVNLRSEFQTTLMDSDGLTRHGVMRFRAVIFDN